MLAAAGNTKNSFPFKMVSLETVRKLALAFEGANEEPHFERTSFRVNKKIFATLDTKTNKACLMLSLIDQSVFCTFDPKIIYPVPNKWGKSGATYFELKGVREDMFCDALTCAYCKVAPPQLAARYKNS